MYWTYQIKAAAGQRVLMRLIQIFDQQLVLLQRCLLVKREGVYEITIVIRVEEDLARRIHAKLYKQYEIDVVEIMAGKGSLLDPLDKP